MTQQEAESDVRQLRLEWRSDDMGCPVTMGSLTNCAKTPAPSTCSIVLSFLLITSPKLIRHVCLMATIVHVQAQSA